MLLYKIVGVERIWAYHRSPSACSPVLALFWSNVRVALCCSSLAQYLYSGGTIDGYIYLFSTQPCQRPNLLVEWMSTRDTLSDRHAD